MSGLRWYSMGVTAITLAVGLACGNGVGPDLAPQVRSVTVAPASATIRVRETVRLVANLDADAGVDLSVTWSSSDPAVAIVDAQKGLVTGVAIGTALITATSDADPSKTGGAMIVVTA